MESSVGVFFSSCRETVNDFREMTLVLLIENDKIWSATILNHLTISDIVTWYNKRYILHLKLIVIPPGFTMLEAFSYCQATLSSWWYFYETRWNCLDWYQSLCRFLLSCCQVRQISLNKKNMQITEISNNLRYLGELCIYQTKVSILIFFLFFDAQANHLLNTYLKLVVIYHMHVVK